MSDKCGVCGCSLSSFGALATRAEKAEAERGRLQGVLRKLIKRALGITRADTGESLTRWDLMAYDAADRLFWPFCRD
jgi:hypothetical protein